MSRVLIVAYRTAATPPLLAAVRERAAQGPCEFTLLLPRPYWDADTEESALTLELALPLLDEAAAGHVEGLVGDTDPFVAVQGAMQRTPFDEIIVSTLPTGSSRWLGLDLPRRLQKLTSVPVRHVVSQPPRQEVPTGPPPKRPQKMGVLAALGAMVTRR